MIDIVIPFSFRSNQSVELRYTFRSIEKCLSDYRHIFIVGDCPGWVRNVSHLPFKEYDTGAKYHEKNIFLKTLHACEYISGNRFLFMNDDHFLLHRRMDAEAYPLYYSGTLKSQYAAKMDTPYSKILRNTITLLGENKMFYDIHCPMIFNVDTLMRISRFWGDQEYGYCLKTFHRYWDEDIENGWLQQECKILGKLSEQEITNLIKHRPFFSTADDAVNDDMLKVFADLYPSKCIYEV